MEARVCDQEEHRAKAADIVADGVKRLKQVAGHADPGGLPLTAGILKSIQEYSHRIAQGVRASGRAYSTAHRISKALRLGFDAVILD